MRTNTRVLVLSCRRVTNSSEEGRKMSRYAMHGEGCNVQDIVHVRPGNKSIIEHTTARRNQRQENKGAKGPAIGGRGS